MHTFGKDHVAAKLSLVLAAKKAPNNRLQQIVIKPKK